jgi:hypothetical protein
VGRGARGAGARSWVRNGVRGFPGQRPAMDSAAHALASRTTPESFVMRALLRERRGRGPVRSSGHRSYQEAYGARTRTRLREQVRDAAIALTHRGLYPSASHIADVLDDRNVMRSHTAQAVWREVLRDLGWSRPNMELRAVMAQTVWG